MPFKLVLFIDDEQTNDTYPLPSDSFQWHKLEEEMEARPLKEAYRDFKGISYWDRNEIPDFKHEFKILWFNN